MTPTLCCIHVQLEVEQFANPVDRSVDFCIQPFSPLVHVVYSVRSECTSQAEGQLNHSCNFP